MFHMRAGVLAVLAAAMVGGCRKEDDEITILNALQRGGLSIVANGGSATGHTAGTGGGWGGFLFARPMGNLLVGVNPPPLAPPLPAPPSLAQTVTSWTDVQTVPSGSAVVNGDITAAGSSSAPTLNVSAGDLVINGSITTVDNGTEESNLWINVPAGTVWINGTIRTGGVDGVADGDTAGTIYIMALRIIFTGQIDARGEDNPDGPGGLGGVVYFHTEGAGTGQTSQLLVGGAMNTSGGTSAGLDATGGAAGGFFSFLNEVSSGAVHVSGTSFISQGGAAAGTGDVTGGDGGWLYLQANAGVFFNGSFAARGGDAASSDGNATGGNGGSLDENSIAAPDSGPCALYGTLDVGGGSAACGPASAGQGGNAGSVGVLNGSDVNLGTGTFSMKGGDADGLGGGGGGAWLEIRTVKGDIHCDATIDVSCGNGAAGQIAWGAGWVYFQTAAGDIQIAGSFLLNGGNGSGEGLSGRPSDGGQLYVQTGNGSASSGGSVTFRGRIQADGGSDSDPSDDNDGGRGGYVGFYCYNPRGSIYLEPGSSIQADGGAAGGPSLAPVGGQGGWIEFITPGGSVADGAVGGNIRMGGSILARGGAGGGSGGGVFAASDSYWVGPGGGDGRGGDIELTSGSVIDVSGGTGAAGGDARNDGIADSVTDEIAVTFDADGNNSNNASENGIVLNLGTIIARGAAVDGSGGDLLFDGINAAGTVGPLEGAQDRSGAGAGLAGDFLGQ